MAADSLDRLVTEARREQASSEESTSTRALVEAMNREDATVPPVVGSAADAIAEVVDAVVGRLSRGGRLVYVGAGTSGRLAALDAEECESTFSTEPGQVVALVAGDALAAAAERDAAEDDAEAGATAMRGLGVTDSDAVIGVSASGRTPYVLGAVREAAAAGAVTACVVSVPDAELARVSAHEIRVVVGPEFVAGSTRLKAGTAQKLVLNTISTLSMIRLGKTFAGLMVDVAGTNEKLRARARRAAVAATGASPEAVEQALAAADGNAKVAIVSLLAGVDAGTARSRLAASGGDVRRAVGP